MGCNKIHIGERCPLQGELFLGALRAAEEV